MSPIGRVFIVLNLILAGVFVGFAGTNLQKQHDWKATATERAADLDKERGLRKADNEKSASEISQLQKNQGSLQTAISKADTENKNLKDENQRLSAQLSSIEGDVKGLRSVAEANTTEVKTMSERAQKAFDLAMAAEKVRDDSVRAKDTAEAENRDLKATIAKRDETIQQKDMQIAGLNKEKGELTLLVDVARANGFSPSMATPKLAGVVSSVSDRLLTISINDNPTKAEIKAGYKFAIYDASGYKGEARVTDADATRGVAFCTLEIVKGQIKNGDSASTQLGSR